MIKYFTKKVMVLELNDNTIGQMLSMESLSPLCNSLRYRHKPRSPVRIHADDIMAEKTDIYL